MLLTDLLMRDCVKVPLEAREKTGAIEELLDLLRQTGRLGESFEAVREAVLVREKIRSTGVGQGFAIPHGKTAAVDEMMLAVGKTLQPIDFGSIDGQPVEVIVLLISPARQTGEHIQALARISRVMTDRTARGRLWGAKDAEEFYRALDEYEQQAH